MRLDTGVCVSCLLREGLEGGDEVSQVFYQSVLAEVDAPPTESGRPACLAISRDERSIFYSQMVHSGSDIVMVEGFR